MRRYQQSGNITLNILLVIMFIIIAVLIYILAGGTVPEIGKSVGVQSPEIQTQSEASFKTDGTFSDGLTDPTFSDTYELDEFGTGISERDIFDVDINNDGRNDRITRTRNENGTSHFYYQYKIELNQNGNFVDITPDGFRTTEGAECALQKLQFKFKPEFRVIKISRDWQDSWDTPTQAIKTVYGFQDGGINQIKTEPMKVVCDVADLF